MQRLEAQQQRVKQLAVVAQHRFRRRQGLGQRSVGPVTCCTQTFAQAFELGTIRLGAVADTGAQCVAGLLHRQLGGKVVHVAQIQVSGHPAGQQQNFTSHGGGNVRVAVTVAAHPGGESDRRSFQRQMQPGGGVQHVVSLAQVVRNGVPEGMLDDRKAPLGLVDRRRPDTPNLFGVPGLGDQTLQARGNLRALGAVEVAMVQRRQLRGNGVVLLDQRAAGNFGGVSGQHQLDFQLAQLARQGFRLVTFCFQTIKQFGQHPRLERQRLRIVTPVHELILLGNVGQVEKLVEGPGYRQQFVIFKPVDA